MKTTLLTTLSIFGAICSYSQTFGVKVYQNTDFFKTIYNESSNNLVTSSEQVNFNRISLAVDIHTKNGFLHEVEFFIPEISKSVDNIQYPMNYEFRKDATFDGEATSYSLRYELSKTLTNESNRFAFAIGAGINPYYVHIEYIPNVETTYYWSTKLYGFGLNLIPRINYKISRRFIIDLNVPLKIYDLRAEKNQVNNPAIPIRQQETEDLHHIFFESAYTIRLGLEYKFAR
ncbi:MAG TPA: hypothetical protein VK589_26885 [Chryseolinea sp.]|nr:hypothetical protein [Chryseolinea sp.]